MNKSYIAAVFFAEVFLLDGAHAGLQMPQKDNYCRVRQSGPYARGGYDIPCYGTAHRDTYFKNLSEKECEQKAAIMKGAVFNASVQCPSRKGYDQEIVFGVKSDRSTYCYYSWLIEEWFCE